MAGCLQLNPRTFLPEQTPDLPAHLPPVGASSYPGHFPYQSPGLTAGLPSPPYGTMDPSHIFHQVKGQPYGPLEPFFDGVLVSDGPAFDPPLSPPLSINGNFSSSFKHEAVAATDYDKSFSFSVHYGGGGAGGHPAIYGSGGSNPRCGDLQVDGLMGFDGHSHHERLMNAQLNAIFHDSWGRRGRRTERLMKTERPLYGKTVLCTSIVLKLSFCLSLLFFFLSASGSATHPDNSDVAKMSPWCNLLCSTSSCGRRSLNVSLLSILSLKNNQ